MAQSLLVKQEGLLLREVSGGPRPVLITNKLKRYFCLFYLMTDIGSGSPDYFWHLRQWVLGFKESTHL